MRRDLAARWWVVAILLAIYPHLPMLWAEDAGVGMCVAPAGTGMETFLVAVFSSIVAYWLTVALVPVLVALAIAAMWANATLYRLLIRLGAGTTFLTAVIYAYSSVLSPALCSEEVSFAWTPTFALYLAVAACVLNARMTCFGEGFGGWRRLANDPLLWIAFVIVLIPTAVNATRTGPAWIGYDRIPRGLSTYLSSAGMIAPLVILELLVALGAAAFLILPARRRKPTATRVAVIALAFITVLGLFFTPPLVNIVDSATAHLVPSAHELAKSFGITRRDPVLEAQLREVIAATEQTEPLGISPGWFSLAYAAAAVLLILRTRRASTR